jgi:hypothetical protein
MSDPHTFSADQKSAQGLAVSLVGINNPTPAVAGNGAAIAPRPASSAELVSDQFQYFTLLHRLDAKIDL